MSASDDRVDAIIEEVVCGWESAEPSQESRRLAKWFSTNDFGNGTPRLSQNDELRLAAMFEAATKKATEAALEAIGEAILVENMLPPNVHERLLQRARLALKRKLRVAIMPTSMSDHKEEPTTIEGHDEPCHICGETTNVFAGDPGEWPVALVPPDGEPGVAKWHCAGCVQDRIRERDDFRTQLVRICDIAELVEHGTASGPELWNEIDAVRKKLSDAREAEGPLHIPEAWNTSKAGVAVPTRMTEAEARKARPDYKWPEAHGGCPSCGDGRNGRHARVRRPEFADRDTDGPPSWYMACPNDVAGKELDTVLDFLMYLSWYEYIPTNAWKWSPQALALRLMGGDHHGDICGSAPPEDFKQRWRDGK